MHTRSKLRVWTKEDAVDGSPGSPTRELSELYTLLVRETTAALHAAVPGSQTSVCVPWDPIDSGRDYDYAGLAVGMPPKPFSILTPCHARALDWLDTRRWSLRCVLTPISRRCPAVCVRRAPTCSTSWATTHGRRSSAAASPRPTARPQVSPAPRSGRETSAGSVKPRAPVDRSVGARRPPIPRARRAGTQAGAGGSFLWICISVPQLGCDGRRLRHPAECVARGQLQVRSKRCSG